MWVIHDIVCTVVIESYLHVYVHMWLLHFGVKQLRIGNALSTLQSCMQNCVKYVDMEGFCWDSHICTYTCRYNSITYPQLLYTKVHLDHLAINVLTFHGAVTEVWDFTKLWKIVHANMKDFCREQISILQFQPISPVIVVSEYWAFSMGKP